MISGRFRALLFALALVSICRTAAAETAQLRVAIQDGLAYLPFLIMENDRLVEKHAKGAGLGDTKVVWTKFASGAVMNDALLSSSLDIATGGVPPLATLWARTRDNIDVRALSGWVSVPGYLITRNPNVKSVRDLTEKDRIAVPAVRSSNQAIYLEMAAEKAFGAGQHAKLNPLTISMSHSDAAAAMLSSGGEITTHFTIEPYASMERAKGMRPILTSYELLGGPATTSLVWTTSRFYKENPKLSAAFVAALQEAFTTIDRDRKAAAELYLKLSKTKESIDSITGMLNDPNMVFSATPKGIGPQVDFMHRSGFIKVKPDSWRDLFFPTVHHLPGC
jgi:NitT/TauT family transport system substrate-binding protein